MSVEAVLGGMAWLGVACSILGGSVGLGVSGVGVVSRALSSVVLQPPCVGACVACRSASALAATARIPFHCRPLGRVPGPLGLVACASRLVGFGALAP